MIELSKEEFEVLDALWQNYPASASQIIERISDDNNWRLDVAQHWDVHRPENANVNHEHKCTCMHIHAHSQLCAFMYNRVGLIRIHVQL